ncbi:MAG: DUF1093 domain-containing protein [Kurthia sp.]|nr:DUF1093 domain-containing protein [Candidatus Kurthia equi]
MKIIFKQLLIFCLGLSIMLGVGYLIGGDRYMPWTKKEVLYVVIHKAEETPLDNGHSKFETLAINTKGEKKLIQFETAHDVVEGTFLKLYSKGNYTSSTEIVQLDAIPENIRKKLY